MTNALQEKKRKNFMPLCTNPSSCSIICMYKVCMYYTEIKLLITKVL